MSSEILEVERKYDVDSGTELPPLDGVVDGAVHGTPESQTLVATYLDTADLRLLAARTTLRHRTGGSDAGWHLKLPREKGRTEVRVDDDGSGSVPQELQALVRAAARGLPLAPVAELRTSRTAVPVQDASGRVLVEVVDDRVEARLLGVEGEQPLAWREWEAELVSGDDADLDAVEVRLLAAGAVPSASSSKAGRVLARHPGAGGGSWWSQLPTASRGDSAGEVLRAHLAEQVAELVSQDPHVRRDEHDCVHKMRVATRRLRSALSTFGRLLDRSRTDPVRDELRWLAAVLGEARDAEVMHARLRGLLAAEPAELLLGPVQRTVDEVMGKRYARAHAQVVAELDGPRYLALLQVLDELVAAPPLQGKADRPAREVLPRLVARSHRRLTAALDDAAAEHGEAQDLALHEARKQAKRVRYACEAVAPVMGRPAKRLAAAVSELQDVLGEHQDSVATRQVLRELGALSNRSGSNGFTFGRLHGLEQARADASHDRWRSVRDEVTRGKRVHWLD